MNTRLNTTGSPYALFIAFLVLSGCEKGIRPETASVERLEPVVETRNAPDAEFGQITDIGVDSRGFIYAGDALGEIFVLDARGRLSRRFGRTGNGPGEYQNIGTIHLLADDSLFVYDGAAQRATVYAPHGQKVAYTIRLPIPDFAFPMNVQPMRSGLLSAHFRPISGDVPTDSQRRDDLIRLLNRDGSIARDSVLRIAEPETVEIQSGQSHGYYHPPFSRQTLVRWGQDGRIYSLWTDSARVDVHDETGRPRGGFTARLPAPRLELSDATVDSIAQANTSPGITARMLSQAFRSRWRTWPLVDDMLIDDRSRVWIKPVTHDTVSDWLAFDARGTQVAALRLPATDRPRVIRGDRLYAITRDSLDVESLVVYRLAPASTSPREGP
jgi:6-bladed beta-propeller